MQFIGTYKGTSWNSQALFARKTGRQQGKQRHAARLAESHDFVGLQETHSTDGSVRAFRAPAGVRCFWSHASVRQAGVALWVKETFLAKFNPVTNESWVEIEQGRAGVLRLRGAEGALDIFVLYHHTGSSALAKAARDSTRTNISAAVRPQPEVLSILMGDFNYVAHKRDRFSKVDANWSDNEDATEERRFCRILRDPFGFCELEQEEYTHDSARGRSRLDRIYSNHHLTDQLDRRIGCAALAWVRQLSAHRPVAFFRQHSAHGNVDNRFPAAPMKDPRWSQRVALRYGELRRSDASEDQPIRRLLLIKQAIRDVCKKMDNEQTEREAVSTDDKLGWTMRYIRTAEELRFGALRKCVQAYPHLISLAHPDDPNSRLGTGLQAVRQHAIELARTAVADDIHKLYRDRQQLDEMQRTVRRDSIQLRLKRLVPGAASALNAVCTADGSITTEPVAMADALRSHWGPTFAARAIDGDMLNAWLQEVYPDGGSGYAVSGLPCPTSDAWRVDRESIEKAVTISSDSMPGPDGIPYVAWRCLGPLGIDILLDAASTLASPDGPRLMQNANGASSDDHEFNLGILCCLPKKASGNDPTVGHYHAAENTRPLSIVNTDNRLIANAYGLKWEPVFNTWISQYQQGFLQGRSMLSNVVDVDFEAMTVSLQHAHGAVILFDFKAAFPSISH
jgi:exonuclease III